MKALSSLVLILFLVNPEPVSGEGITGHIGEAFQSENVKEKGVRGIFISQQSVYTLPVDGAIFKFRAYVVEQYPVWFQLWRPTGAMTYSLVGQVELKPTLISKFYDIPVPKRSPIIAKQGDVLGIFNNKDACALAYQFIQGASTSGSWHSSTEEVDTVIPSDTRKFEMKMPYRFSVEAYYDTDTLKYMGPFDPVSTTDVNVTQGQMEEIPVTSGTLNYTGNSLAGRNQILSDDAKAMYLFPHILFSTGVVVEFHAFFRKKQQVVFQVWRQYGKNSYALVGSYVYLPPNVPAYEKVSLSLGSYIFVQDRDILGVAFLSDVGPIAYRMTGFQGYQGPYLASIVNNRLPRTGEIVTFGNTHYPYDFAIGAIYDSDTDPAKYGTRPPTFMPEFPTSPTEPTGKTENPTPAIPFTPFSVEVPNDHVLIGEKYLNRASSILSSSARTAFILTKLKFPLSCLVVAFHAYVVQPGKVYFQIWRGHDDSGSKFELIGQKGITVEGTIVDGFEPRLMQIMLENDEQIYVKEGDCIGLSNDQETSVIGYHFQASSTYSSEQPISPAIGDIVTFDQLSHPYKFALAATLKKDGVTTQSNDADVEITSSDDVTSKPVTEKLVETTDSFSWIMDAKVVFGLLIWLIILTVLFLMLLACFLCGVHKQTPTQQENKRTSFLYDYQSKNSVARTPSDYLTHSPNKENDVISYFNPKTGSKSGPVMRNDSMKEQLIGSEDTEDKYSASVNINNNNKRPASVYSDYSDGTVTVINHQGDLHTHM